MISKGIKKLSQKIPFVNFNDGGPRPDDVYLVSYPRSGNTWVRTIIARQLYSQRRIRSLEDLDVLVPDLHRSVSDEARGVSSYLSNSLVIKSHFPRAVHRSQSNLGEQKIIYLVRHPRDVVTSYFDYKKNVGGGVQEASFEKFVDMFVNGAVWPCSWREHVVSWTKCKKGSVMVLKYENIKEDTNASIRRIASFLGVSITDKEVKRVEKFSSRQNMVSLEEKGSLVDSSYNFVRRSSDKRLAEDQLTDELVERIRRRSKLALNTVSYI